MAFPFYDGKGKQRNDLPVSLPGSRRAQMLKPENYLADAGLVDACNVALLLGQPILLTGEPGTGKTEFAASLAWELGLARPLKYETKSTTSARDIFYIYDALKRFQDAQSNIKSEDALPYISYQALGEAIVRTREPADVAKLLPVGFEHTQKTRSVVLIDEIDKAPRDFPNDILNELERMYFRIPELGGALVEADPALLPIVIITSNSEKDLPDAFLRRCVYYNISFPAVDRLKQIVSGRLGLYATDSSTFINDALELFNELRSPATGLRKNPATAELLDWMLALREISGNVENPLAAPELALRTLSNLIKTAEDQKKAQGIVQRWVDKRKKT
jgi:MoxR-like ATPase